MLASSARASERLSPLGPVSLDPLVGEERLAGMLDRRQEWRRPRQADATGNGAAWKQAFGLLDAVVVDDVVALVYRVVRLPREVRVVAITGVRELGRHRKEGAVGIDGLAID